MMSDGAVPLSTENWTCADLTPSLLGVKARWISQSWLTPSGVPAQLLTAMLKSFASVPASAAVTFVSLVPELWRWMMLDGLELLTWTVPNSVGSRLTILTFPTFTIGG